MGGREKHRFSSLSRKLPVQGEIERPNQRCIRAEWAFSLKQVFSLLHSCIRLNDMMTLLVHFHWMWLLTVLPKRTIFRSGSACMNFLFVRNHNLSHSQVCEKTWGWIVKLFAGVASCLQWGFTTLKNNFWGKLSIWCGWWRELFMCCGASVIPWWGENSQLMVQQLGFGQSELQYSFQIWVVTFRTYGPTVGEDAGVACCFFFFKVERVWVGSVLPLFLIPCGYGLVINLSGQETSLFTPQLY